MFYYFVRFGTIIGIKIGDFTVINLGRIYAEFLRTIHCNSTNPVLVISAFTLD